MLRAPNRAPVGVAPGETESQRQIGNAGNFIYHGSGGASILHSMRVRVNRRFASGLRLENTYTLAKSIDDASGVGGGSLIVVQDERNTRLERSLSSFDQRHRLRSDFSYDLPFGDGRRFLADDRRVVSGFVSGWTLSGGYQFGTGYPVSARILGNLSNNSGTGSNSSERPDSTGVPISMPLGERTTAHYFNTAAFALPAGGTFGNAGRFTIAGPASNLVNLQVRKDFRLNEQGRRVEFRWRVTNVLNHPNYGGLGTVINAKTFGRVTSARAMRQIEFELRIIQ